MPNLVEKAASEMLGAFKSATARIEGLTGVFQHLAREHGEIMALLLRLEACTDPKVRAELFPVIRRELLAHERGEVAEVYPVLRQCTDLVAFAQAHDRNAGTLETAIEALAVIDYEDPSWTGRFAELVTKVREHAAAEETRFFPKAQRLLGKAAAEQLLLRYERAKGRDSRDA